MTIARLLVEELLMRERQERAVAVRLDLDRDQRFALGCAFPGPGEDQLLVRHEFAVNTADIVLFAVRGFHQPAITSAGPRLALDLEHFDFAGAHPAFHFFRVGPSREDFRGRRVEPALEGEARLVAVWTAMTLPPEKGQGSKAGRT